MFDEIVNYFGSQKKLAEILGINKAAVSQWQVDGVPPLRAIEIERLSRGRFKAIEIERLEKERVNDKTENS